jgi:hydroxypyruvate reductase
MRPLQKRRKMVKRPDLLEEMRADAEKIFRVAVARVNPSEAVKRFVHLERERLVLGGEDRQEKEFDLGQFDGIVVVGGGKGTAPMAKALEELMGDRIRKGVVTVKYGFTEKLSFIEIIEAGHPIPDENGVSGTRKILDLLKEANERELIFSLISGGGSALLPQPAKGITLQEKQAITQSLLDCGATIGEMNAVRKHISASKGGQMARLAYPATTVNLMLSDVIGDRMDVIASGPFVPDPSTFVEAWEIISKYRLREIPQSIEEHLKMGMEKKLPETPKKGDPVFDRVHSFIIGSNLLALEAAKNEAERLGYRPLILSSTIQGETREVAKVHSAILKEILASGQPVHPPACIISGGETTVTIKGNGLGGRNQEFCLAAALDLRGLPSRVLVLSGGTDGNDGPTPAAGAIVDPLTVEGGAEAGMNASVFLENNDSYHFFERTKELVITGPTNTNVMDVRIMLVR